MANTQGDQETWYSEQLRRAFPSLDDWSQEQPLTPPTNRHAGTHPCLPQALSPSALLTA